MSQLCGDTTGGAPFVPPGVPGASPPRAAARRGLAGCSFLCPPLSACKRRQKTWLGPAGPLLGSQPRADQSPEPSPVLWCPLPVPCEQQRWPTGTGAGFSPQGCARLGVGSVSFPDNWLFFNFFFLLHSHFPRSLIKAISSATFCIAPGPRCLRSVGAKREFGVIFCFLSVQPPLMPEFGGV